MAQDVAIKTLPQYDEWRAAVAVIPHEARCPTVHHAASECDCITGDAVWSLLRVGWCAPIVTA